MCMFLHNPLIWYYGQVTSCLDVGANLAATGRLEPWDSVLCQSQTQGRGQMRRTWISPPGNLYACLRLPYVEPFTQDCAAIAVGALLVTGLRDLGLEILLKWPNDLVVSSSEGVAKVGGILIEERRGSILAGIGVNYVASPPSESLRKYAQLPAKALCDLDLALVRQNTSASLWLNLVRVVISTYKDGQAFKNLWPQWFTRYVIWRGREVEIVEHGVPLQGIFHGIGPKGGALLCTAQGSVVEVTGGSLQLARCASC